jgi:hypothetical protein
VISPISSEITPLRPIQFGAEVAAGGDACIISG